jgi:hypothetical protein
MPVISPSRVRGAEHGVEPDVAPRQNRGHASAHGTVADPDWSVAADDGRMPDQHAAHVGDRVERASSHRADGNA